MPRTQKATIILILLLATLAILTLFNVLQTQSTQSTVIELRQQVETLAASNQDIRQQLEKGVAVSGTTSSGSSGAEGKYADALDDPENILTASTDLQIPADAKFGGTYRGYLSSDLKGFNWITENSVDVSNIQAQVHNGFARRDFNKPDNWVPELAYKITVSEDQTEYTIHIRDDVYWHTPKVDFSDPRNEWLKEPRKLTAEDCVFYFELVKNPQVEAGALKNYYEELEKAWVVDEHTFKVKWKRKLYNSKSFTIGVYPLPKWLFTKDQDGNDLPEETLGLKFNNHWASKHAIGTGPYQMVESKTGERTVLERFDKYWGKKYPIERLEYKVIKDPQTAYVKFLAGELDLIGKVPNPKVKSDIFEGGEEKFAEGKLEYDFVDVFAYYYFGWNMDKPMFSDKLVRKAMTHSLNRPLILKNVLNGLGTIQTGPFYYKHPATDDSIEPWPFDLEKAKALLDEAGWKDTDGDGIRDKVIKGQKTDFNFTMVAYDKPETKTVLSIWKEDLRKIGVVLKAQHVDWPTMQKKMDEKKFDAWTGGWGLGWLIDPYQIWHSSQADVPKGSNRGGFRNERADEIIERLRVTFDEEERMQLYHEFHSILHEEQPYTFFYSPQYVTAWQPRMENMIINKIRPQHLPFPWYIDDSQKKAKVQGKR
jgi:ABC-type transport system substrate-binding protein